MRQRTHDDDDDDEDFNKYNFVASLVFALHMLTLPRVTY